MKHFIKNLSCLTLFLTVCLFCVLPALLPAGETQVQAAQKKSSSVYSLNRTIKHIRKKSSFVLKVRGGAKKVKWVSSNNKVAVVKKKSKTTAVVTTKSAGTCKIFAKVGKKTLSCVVQVTARTRKAGTFKDGAFDTGKQKIYTLKSALASSGGNHRFGNAHCLYLGASRTRDTAKAVNDPDVYFYSYAGCGIDCLFRKMFSDGKWKTPGIKLIDSFLKKQPYGRVFIDLGGNDLGNIKAYINLYKTLIRRYPTADFRFISVLPREDGTNKKRQKFNKQLKKAFPSRVIDLYSFVWSHPLFDTVDGVHYGPGLSRIVYEKVMQSIGRRISVDMKTGDVTEAAASGSPRNVPEETVPEETVSDIDEEHTGEAEDGAGSDAVDDAG